MSVNVLKTVWGKQKGYVFVPRRKPNPNNPKSPTWDEGRAFTYPEEWSAIKARCLESAKDGWDTYWCPLVFDKPQRLKECAKPEQYLLWADLDDVDPTKLGALRPTIAWQSSDDRYQSLWVLEGKEKIEDVEQVNKDLSYFVGADKGGWDVTQVLRVPGSPNHKYDPPQQGKFLWAEKKYFVLDKVNDVVKGASSQPGETAKKSDSLTDLLDGWTISQRARDLIFIDESEVQQGERSDRLWEIETLLVEAGLPLLTIIDVVSLCPWNKFKGRKNEKAQIHAEVLKAEAHVKARTQLETQQKTEQKQETLKLLDSSWAVPFDTFLSKDIEKPSWLVEGIWQKGTYGMIAGEPKTYKSVQATDLAVSVASGRPFLGVFDVKTQGNVLYIQEENNEQTVQDRLVKVASGKGLVTSTPFGWGIPDNLPLFVSNNCGINLTQQESRDMVENTIKDINPVLIILDPLYMMLGNADENSAKEVGDVLRWLTYIRNQYKTAILICHHYNKGGNNAGRGGQRVRGSSAFHAWVESALYVKTTDVPGKVKVEREFRAFPHTAEIEVTLELGSPGDPMYKATVALEDVHEELNLKKEEICTILSASPRTQDELRTLTGSTVKEIRQMLKEMVMDGVLVKSDNSGGGRGHVVKYMLNVKTGGDTDGEEVPVQNEA